MPLTDDAKLAASSLASHLLAAASLMMIASVVFYAW